LAASPTPICLRCQNKAIAAIGAALEAERQQDRDRAVLVVILPELVALKAAQPDFSDVLASIANEQRTN
jgi:hypothetical protein